jgi:hypothetical protein
MSYMNYVVSSCVLLNGDDHNSWADAYLYNGSLTYFKILCLHLSAKPKEGHESSQWDISIFEPKSEQVYWPLHINFLVIQRELRISSNLSLLQNSKYISETVSSFLLVRGVPEAREQFFILQISLFLTRRKSECLI